MRTTFKDKSPKQNFEKDRGNNCYEENPSSLLVWSNIEEQHYFL